MEINEDHLKNLIKTSIINADPKTMQITGHVPSRDKVLSKQTIEAYEIAFTINFQPALLKHFLKIIANYIYKYKS